MKHITKLTVGLITIALVSYSKSESQISTDVSTKISTSNPVITARQDNTPLHPVTLNRLAYYITVEIVTRSVVSGGDPFGSSGSGVIIGKKDSTYYVLSANHIFLYPNDYRVVVRSTKPGEDAEILKLEIIYRYPDADLAVLKFGSVKKYGVAEVGEVSQLRKNSQVYVGGWPGVENRAGFQFTPAKVTNPRAGDLLTYEPTVPGEDVSPGMSGGAVLNEEGHLIGIHRGLTKVDGDGEGVLVSTFLRDIAEEVEEVLVRATPDVFSASAREKRKVELERELAAERRKREEAERRLQELEAEREKERQKAEQRAKQEQTVELLSQPEQATLATRKPGPPLGRSALNRLAENITIEIVTPSYLIQGGLTQVGSGVIIGRNRDTYYVLTAKHIFDYQDYGHRIIIRSKRPGEDLELVQLEVIYFYPDADLAVVAFASRRQYTVAKIGEPSELKKNSQVYIGGWPGVENREGFQFTPAKVTNPRAKDGDSFAYEPTEAGEDVYPGMSGGPVLNEEGHLMGIHVGLMELDGDGKGLLVSAFLREIREEVEKVLVRASPDT